MADRRVYVTTTCLGCSTSTIHGYVTDDVELLGECLMRRRNRKTFAAAEIVVMSIVVDKCEACAKRGGDGG